MQREQNRRGQGERLRADILTATRDLLEQAGTDEGLTLRGVARAVGISPQAMYLHFAGLDDLVLAVLDDCHRAMGAALDATVGTEPDPVERVLARGRAYLAWGVEHPGLYQVMYEGRVQAVGDRAALPPGRQLLHQVRDDVRAAMDAGAVPAGDPYAVALQLWALVHGLVSLRANKPNVPWPDLAQLATAGGRRLLAA